MEIGMSYKERLSVLTQQRELVVTYWPVYHCLILSATSTHRGFLCARFWALHPFCYTMRLDHRCHPCLQRENHMLKSTQLERSRAEIWAQTSPNSTKQALGHCGFLSLESKSSSLALRQINEIKESSSCGNRLEFLKRVILLLFNKWSLRSLRDGGRQRGRSSECCSGSFGIPRVLRDEGWGLGNGIEAESAQSLPSPSADSCSSPKHHTRAEGHLPTQVAHHSSGLTLAP